MNNSLRDDVLDKTDIVDLVSKYVHIKKVGKNRSGLCPFHKEKTPSFTVAEDKQIFKCFGCGKGGNAISFLMEIERMDFWDSLKSLASDAHIDISAYERLPEVDAQIKSVREKLKLLNKYTQTWFAEHLSPNTVGYDYLVKQRKLSLETIKAFGLWYAPDSHYELIKHLKSKGFTDDDILQAWVAKKGSSGDVYAFFRQRVSFPIKDHIGNVVWFGARALDPETQPKYLNTTETPLYDKSKILYGLYHAKDTLREHQMLVLVEGYMDVIALAQYGLPIGIAPCGTAVTSEQIKLVSRHTDNLVLALDNDQAGFEATIRALKVAYAADMFPQIFQLPTAYKDIDQRLATSGQQIDAQMIKNMSSDGFSWIVQELLKRHDINNPVLRKKFLQTWFELCSKVEDLSVLHLYLQQLAAALDMPIAKVDEQYQSFYKQQHRLISSGNDHTTIQRKGPSPQYLLWALYYQGFVQQQLQLTNEKLETILQLIADLSSYFPSSLIKQIQDWTHTENQELLEAQLRREQELWQQNKDKQAQHLHHFLMQQLNTIEKVLNKSSKLDAEQKNHLHQRIKEIKKRG